MGGSPADQIEALIQFGQPWDALQKVTGLINQAGSKADLRLYRLRAQAELQLGMTKECINDATHVISKKKNNMGEYDVKSCLKLRANANLKMGQYKDAEADITKLGDRKSLQDLKGLIEKAKEAEDLFTSGDREKCRNILDLIIQNSPQSSKHVLMRAEIAWTSGDYSQYQSLTERIVQDNSNNGELLYRRGVVYMCDNDMDQAMKSLSSSRHKNASVVSGKIQKLSKLLNNAQRVFDRTQSTQASDGQIKSAELALNTLREHSSEYCPKGSSIMQRVFLLEAKLFRSRGDINASLKILDEALSGTGSDDLHMERGDIYMELKDYEKASFDFQTVAAQGQNRKAQELLQKAQRLKQESEKDEIYNILGITRTASQAQIKEAFKKAVRKYHPDQYGDPIKKKEAEEKMKKVNIAYDTLCDEEKRREYDMNQDGPFSHGSDIFDIFNMFTGGGGGFQHFGFPGGGGNGNFHFEVHFG